MSAYSELMEIREHIRNLADEHRAAPLEWIAEQVYDGIPEDQFPAIVRGLVEREIHGNVRRRGEAKGEIREWYAQRYELLRGNKKRTRVGVSIEYCADGWYSTGGGLADPSEGGPTGDTIPASHVVGEYDYWWERGMDAWKEFHESRPVLWKVRRDAPGRNYTQWYCDDELPDEYRHIADGEGHLDGYEVPEWRREVTDEQMKASAVEYGKHWKGGDC